MTRALRNQVIGVACLIVTFAGLGAVLTYNRQCEANQRTIRVQLEEARAAVDAKRRELDELDQLTTHPEDKVAKKKQLDEAVEQLGQREKDQQKLLAEAAPKWSWLGWVAGLAAVFAVAGAAGAAGPHGRHVIYTVVAAAVAFGFWYFKDPIYGIDLRGGAELRYRMNTSSDDKKIRQLNEVLKKLEAGGDEAKTALAAIDAEVAKLEQQRKDARNEDTRAILQERIDELKQQREADSLDKLIKSLIDRRRQSMVMAVDVIRKRIDGAGIKQVTVREVGDGEMLCQIPIRQVSVDPTKGDAYRLEQQMAQLRSEVDELKALISKPGQLRFHHVVAVRGGYTAKEYEVIAKDIWEGREVPGFFTITYLNEGRKHGQQPQTEEFILRAAPAVAGDQLRRAQVVMGDEGREILVDLTAAGGQAIAEATGPGLMEWSRDRLAIVLDGEVKSAPVVQNLLGSRFRITGKFTVAEADSICQVLNSGSLAYKPVLSSENQVGPGLGQDAIDAGSKATIVGATLVVIFMGFYYMGAGLLADMALLLNLLLLIGAMNLLGGTFTLPGIAGIALTAGMAVDANVLIFERIREEKLRGKPLRLAVKAGHDRALITILDSNITTILTALILYKFGTGAVRGFAVTVTLGILASLFCSLLVTRWMLDLAVERGWVKELRMMRLFGETKFEFMRSSGVMFAFSALLVIGSVFLLSTTKEKYGLDFTGGLEVQMRFAAKHDPVEVRAMCEKARQAMEEDANRAMAGQGAVKVPPFTVQSYNPDAGGKSTDFKVILGGEILEVLSTGAAAGEEGAAPLATAESPAPLAADGPVVGRKVSPGLRDDVTEYLRASCGSALDQADAFPSVTRVGKQVAGELLQRAFLAMALSIFVVFIYILVRFDFMIGFGIGAAVSLAHDAIIALGVLMLANRLGMSWARIDSEIVAAILTIVGYSLNDTIVVYDRIRENIAAHRSKGLRDIVDLSVNQTLSRTALTSATTFLVVLSILLLGGETLRSFSLVFAAGILVGTYSSVFIAAPVTVAWENWMERRRAAAAAAGRQSPAARAVQ